jgi:hypothetical protein
MSFTVFAQEGLNIATVAAAEVHVPVNEAVPSWESLTGEIRRLFKAAIASVGEGGGRVTRVVIAAQRILDAVAAMGLIAELETGDRRARLTFSLEQCEAEAQRLFDAYMDGQQQAVLSAYAERGLMAAYGLTDTPVAVSH